MNKKGDWKELGIILLVLFFISMAMYAMYGWMKDSDKNVGALESCQVMGNLGGSGHCAPKVGDDPCNGAINFGSLGCKEGFVCCIGMKSDGTVDTAAVQDQTTLSSRETKNCDELCPAGANTEPCKTVRNTKLDNCYKIVNGKRVPDYSNYYCKMRVCLRPALNINPGTTNPSPIGQNLDTYKALSKEPDCVYSVDSAGKPSLCWACPKGEGGVYKPGCQ